MDPELGEVTEEEGDAIDVRVAVAEQRRRRRRRRQMARRAAEEELEAEFNRQLAHEVMDTCNSNELELPFPEGRGRNHIQIISWARARAATAPHLSTRVKWRRFFDRYHWSTAFFTFLRLCCEGADGWMTKWIQLSTSECVVLSAYVCYVHFWTAVLSEVELICGQMLHGLYNNYFLPAGCPPAYLLFL